MTKCFYAACKSPVTHTVQRLWLIGGQPLPVLHCCDKHVPGKGPKYAENATLAAKVKGNLGDRVFYDVQRISHAS